jgi:hypothetical protein
MAEQVVEDIGFDHVVELCRGTYPVGDGKAALGQQREEGFLGDQPWHTDDLPARGPVQPLADRLEARNAVRRAELRHRVNEFAAGQALDLCALPGVEPAIGVVVGLGVAGEVLGAGVVAACAGVVAAWRALALTVGDRGDAVIDALVEVWRLHALLRPGSGPPTKWAWGLIERRGASGPVRSTRTAP